MSAITGSRYTSRQLSVVFKDGAGTPNTMTVGPGQGTFALGAMRQGNADVVRVLDRGQHSGFVVTDDLAQDWSIEIELLNQSLVHAAQKRIVDWMQKSNFFSTNTSLDTTIWAWAIVVTMNDGTTTSTITLPLCDGTWDFSEAKEGNKIKLAGKNYTQPTYT